jgi:HlyD family secretion protein
MKRLIIIVICLVVVGGVVALGSAGIWAKLHQPPSALYKTAVVNRGEIKTIVNSSGTVQPVQSVQIGSFVSGPIQKVYVDFNARVKADQILAEVDPRTYKANLAREEASLAARLADKGRVEVLLEQSNKNEQRALKLRQLQEKKKEEEGKEHTYISEFEIDQVVYERKSLEKQVELAEASVAEARASLESAKTNLEFTTIKTPVDGIVTSRKVDEGQTLASQFQTPVMFEVAYKLDEMVYVYASVDEADIGMIRDAAQRKQPVLFTVDAYPNDIFEGKILEQAVRQGGAPSAEGDKAAGNIIQGIRFNPTTVQNVVTYTVVVESSNCDLKLLPGMTANLRFQIERRENALRIPNAALRYRPKADQVRPEDRPILERLAQETEANAQGEGSTTKKIKELPSKDKTPSKKHVWIVDGDFLAAIEVVAGLNDNTYTELVSGALGEGQEVVTGLRTSTASSSPGS